VKDQIAIIGTGSDVEKRQFIGTLEVVTPCDFYRISGIAKLNEVDAFDDATCGHVKARNDAMGKHGRIIARRRTCCRQWRPELHWKLSRHCMAAPA
jgi:hypothetical protein